MNVSRLLAAGSNARGQLATNDLEDAHEFIPCSFLGYHPGILPVGSRNVIQIACGSNHTLLLLQLENAQTQLWGSGDGGKGQLGPSYMQRVSSTTDQTSLFRELDIAASFEHLDLTSYSVRLIAASWETSYAAFSHPDQDDILISFGSNDFGNLGVGHPSKDQKNGTHIVDLRQAKGLTEAKAGSVHIDSLTASTHHVIVRLSAVSPRGIIETHIFGWGASRHGQVSGSGPSKGKPPASIDSPHPIVLTKEHSPVSSVAAGFQHTVFLHSNGSVSAIGSNKKNQLQHMDLLHNVRSVDCTWHGTFLVVDLDEKWSILATGSNNKGQLGSHSVQDDKERVKTSLSTVYFPFAPSTRKLTKLVCGSEHVLCLFTVVDTGISGTQDTSTCTEVWGWGWNEHGNLGTGDTKDVHLPIKIWPHDIENKGRVLDIWAGCGTSWIVVGEW